MGKMPRSGSFMEPSWPSSRMVLPAFTRVMDEAHGVTHVGTDLLAAADEVLIDLVGVHGGLVIEVLEQHVLHAPRRR